MIKTLKLLLVLSLFQVTLFAQTTQLLELWQQKEWTKLINASNAQIQGNKSNYKAYYWKQYALLEQGKAQEAIKTLLNALNPCENKMEIRSELANLYFQQGMYLQAKTELDTLLNLPNPEYRTIEKRVLIHEFSKEYVAAINLLYRGRNIDATKPFYWIHLGDNLKRLGEYDDAVKCYESSLTLNPLDYQTCSKLAKLYLKINPPSTLDICQSVLEKDSTNICFIQMAASAHVKLDNEKEALAQYVKAMTLGDSTLNTIRNAGILYQKSQKSDMALNLLNKSYQIDSTNVNVVYYLAMAETHLFNPDRGLELFDESLNLLQADSSILSMIHKEKGIIFSEKKAHRLALDNYLAAHKLNPKKKFHLFLIAEQYDLIGDKKQALDYYQRVLDGIDEKQGENILTASVHDYSKSRIKNLKEDIFMENN